MQTANWDGIQKIEEVIFELLGSNDEILLTLDVFPLDHVVRNVLAPKLFISRTRLFFVIDNVIEIYGLRDIKVGVLGGEPKFGLIQQFLEFKPLLESSKTPITKNVDLPDEWVRFAISEGNTYPKSFVLRKEGNVLKGYQNWACAQFIRNLQRGVDDYRINNMIHGNFSFFDEFFLIKIFLIFLGYVLFSVILGGILPNILRMILDVLFGLVCILVLGWVFWTIFTNTRKYQKFYSLYKSQEGAQPSVPAVPQQN